MRHYNDMAAEPAHAPTEGQRCDFCNDKHEHTTEIAGQEIVCHNCLFTVLPRDVWKYAEHNAELFYAVMNGLLWARIDKRIK